MCGSCLMVPAARGGVASAFVRSTDALLQS